MKVAFNALIKIISIKSLETGDKEAEMKLRFRVRPEDNKILADLNELHRGDREITVVIMDEVDE